MRALYLSYDGLTDPLGQSQILPYLIGLSKKGHRIDIVAFEKPEAFDRLGQRIQHLCAAHGLGYYPQRYHKRPPVISTLRDIRQMRKIATQLNLANRYELVHCRSYIPAMVGHHLQREAGLKFIFDMRGFYADERVDGGIWPQSNPLYRWVYRYFKRKEQILLRDADWVVSLTRSAEDEMEDWGVFADDHQISVIPCCVDTAHFDRTKVTPSATQNCAAALKLGDAHPIVGYIGSTGTWYLLTEMLAYFKAVLDNYPEAVMVFLTLDPPADVFSKAAEQGIPPEQIRVKAVDRDELPAYLTTFDWSVFFIQPVFSKKASSPTKLGELLSMGIPVVCNAGVGDTDHIIANYRAGLCLPTLDTASIETGAAASAALLDYDRSPLLFGAKEYFSLENGVAEFDQIYHALGT